MVGSSEKKLRVVMAGPLPPLIGGMATVIEDISKSSLPDRVRLELFNTGKETRHRRFVLVALFYKFSLWAKWFKTIGGRERTVVHIHTCSGWSFFLDGVLLMIACLRRRPTVLHIHGARFDTFLDTLPSLLFQMARVITKLATRVVVLSEEWDEKLSQRLPNIKNTVIKNGVPVPEEITKTAETINVKVLFLGNLSERKGVWDLLEAMKSVPRSVQLLFAGGEDEHNIGEKLNQKIRQLNLQENVKWLGPVYGADKKDLLRDVDIFVLPSYAEGLPISLLEAMCAALPVVSTPVGGIPTVVKHNEQGLIVEPGNVKALSGALTTLAGNSELRLKIGATARQTCIEQYSIETVVNRYMDMYSEIINK